MDHRKETANTHVIIRLVHLARFVVYAGLSIALWVEYLTWKPTPSFPGGPNIAQFTLIVPLALLATLATAVRGFLASAIWSFKKKTIIIAAGFDFVELLLIVGFLVATIQHIIAFAMISSALVLSTLFILSFSSFVLCLRIAKKL